MTGATAPLAEKENEPPQHPACGSDVAGGGGGESSSPAGASTTSAPPVLKAQKTESSSAWKKYSSIESCDRAGVLDGFAAAAAAAGVREWVATEKVHGANFCFETDGEAVEYRSRTSKIGDGGKFYNAREKMPRYHGFVLEAFRIARQRFQQDLSSLLIYGEYFGGFWPDGETEPGLRRVQIGVAYSPEHHFYAFDVSLGGVGYMDFDAARELLLEAGFPLVAEPVRRGTFEEALGVDVESLETDIPRRLGHPMPSSFRIAEGVVVRPVMEVRGSGGHDRAIVKKKARAFWEATNQPELARRVAADRCIAPGAAAPDAVAQVAELARDLLNENRLRAVISKDPALLEERQMPKLAGLFCQDALQDLGKLYGDEILALGAKEGPLLKKRVMALARTFVQRNIVCIREESG